MVVPELIGKEFDDFVKEGIVLVDFFADWCMPCVMMGPIVDDLAEEFEGKIKVCKVDIDDSSEIAQKFSVSSIPTFILLKDGAVKEQIMGAMSKYDLGNVLKENL